MSTDPTLQMPIIKKGPIIPVGQASFKKLPPQSTKFFIAADAPGGQGDADIWLARILTTGQVDVLAWPFSQYRRPDLGNNSQGEPFYAFPELDAVTMGDDRTGEESERRQLDDKGVKYDEGILLDLSKAPATIQTYVPYITIYDHNDEGLTLGRFTSLSLVVVDLASGARFETSPASTDPLAKCYVPGSIRRDPNGAWSMHGTEDENARGTTDDAWRVANKLGAKVQTPPL